MLPSALYRLMWLRLRGGLRRLGRGVKTPRGAAFFVIGCVLVIFWIASFVLGGTLSHKSNPETVRATAPLYMLGVTLTMLFLSGGKAISFSAGEIDFLFAGPFSRRAIVIYKIMSTAIAALLMALLFSMWLRPHASLWIAAFIGSWFTWLWAQSLVMTVILARQAIAEQRSNMVLRAILAVALMMLMIGIVQIVRPVLGSGGFDLQMLAHSARQSWMARIILAPFEVLTRTFTAPRIVPDLAQWSAISALQCALVIVALLQLDKYFAEASLAASKKLHEKIRRARKSGGVMAFGSGASARGRLPMLPWMGGAGPMGWRQLTNALRSGRGMLTILFILAMGAGPVFWMFMRHGEAAAPMFTIIGMWITLVLPNMFRFDFRSDAPHMDVLKALPLSASAIAVGQVLAPVVVLSLIDLVLLAVGAAMVESLRAALLAAMFLVPPLNMLIISVENLLFLLFPSKQAMVTPGDFQMFGRQFVTLFLKGIAIMIACGAAAGLGAVAYVLSDGNWPLVIAVAWMTLAGAALLTVPLMARAFNKFDPSWDAQA